jgi:hypothetical protein
VTVLDRCLIPTLPSGGRCCAIWIFGDMSLIQEFYHPNIILMGCGAVADGQYARMA